MTEEQKKQLEEIFKYTDKASITDEEFKLAKKMFDKPEKFDLLRRILSIFISEEQGIVRPDPKAMIDLRPDDLNKYGMQVAIETLAQEKVRQSLLSFYMQLKNFMVEEKKKEFEEINKQEAEEQRKKEEFEEQQEIEARELGENI